MTNRIIQILRNSARRRIRPETEQKQCGFVKETGTSNATFMLRIISDRTTQRI